MSFLIRCVFMDLALSLEGLDLRHSLFTTIKPVLHVCLAGKELKSTTTTNEFKNLHGDKCLQCIGKKWDGMHQCEYKWKTREDSQNNLTNKNTKYGMDGRCEKHTEIPAEGTFTTFEDWSVSAMSLQLARYTPPLASNFTNKKSKEKRKVLFLVLLLLVFFISESSFKILDQIS